MPIFVKAIIEKLEMVFPKCLPIMFIFFEAYFNLLCNNVSVVVVHCDILYVKSMNSHSLRLVHFE